MFSLFSAFHMPMSTSVAAADDEKLPELAQGSWEFILLGALGLPRRH
jgi:hypothetical protein